MVWGNHAHLEGLNLVGLKRRDFSRETISELRSAYRLLFAEEGTFQERIDDAVLTFGKSAPLGLIAGGGTLPVEIAQHCERSGRALFVIRLKGFAGDDLRPYAGAEVGLAEIGKCLKALKRAGCRAVCLAGDVA
eukprot:gene21685-29781_t